MCAAQARLQAGGGREDGGDAAIFEIVGGLQAGELDVDEAVVVKREEVTQAVATLRPAG